MYKKYIVGLFLAILSISNAQTIVVKDATTNAPLESVIISTNGKKTVQTNANGEASISELGDFKYLVFNSLGCERQIFSKKQLQAKSYLIWLVPMHFQMDEVVVSGSKWKQKTSEIPQKINVISTQDVTLQNPQTAADLLSVSGKVFIQKSQQGGGSPMIRGFSTNRLLYSIDGVRMNTAIFRGGNIQNVISLDPFAIEKTEVVFGPGSVIYGSDAIGGVMSFQTLTPMLAREHKEAVFGNAFARYSSANEEKTSHIDVNIGFKNWAFVSSLSTNNFGDLRMGSHGPDEYLRNLYVERIDGKDVVITNDNPKKQIPTGYSQVNTMQKIRFKPNEKWDFQYGFHYSQTSDYSRYDRHILFKNGMPKYGEFSYGPQKWMMNNLEIAHKTNTKLYDELSVKVAHQFFEESRYSRNSNKPDREVRIEKVNAYSANTDFLKATSSKNKLFYGLEFVYNDVNSIGINENIDTNSSKKAQARYPQANWQSFGIYLNDQYKFSEKVLFQAGLRYNQVILNADFDTPFFPFPFTEAKLNNDAITGSLGLVYRPKTDWIISTNVASAFRSPNVDDIGKVFDSEPGSVVIPNPDLNSEYAYNVDFNIAKMFGKTVKIDFSTYYTLLEDALVRRDFTLNGTSQIMYDGELSNVQAIQNATKATIYGFQAGIEVKLLEGFSFSSDFNFQKGEEEVDNGERSPSRHAAPFFGTTRISYAISKFDFQLNAQYSGKRDFENLPEEEKGKTEIYAIDSQGNPYSPSWYTLNFKSMYKWNEKLLLTTGVENITDQRYRTYSSGIVAPGINFIMALRVRF
jgi:hemoglobin/transferrin/lactoferrin receptor protein